jgi:hypothetical protein
MRYLLISLLLLSSTLSAQEFIILNNRVTTVDELKEHQEVAKTKVLNFEHTGTIERKPGKNLIVSFTDGKKLFHYHSLLKVWYDTKFVYVTDAEGRFNIFRYVGDRPKIYHMQCDEFYTYYKVKCMYD